MSRYLYYVGGCNNLPSNYYSEALEFLSYEKSSDQHHASSNIVINGGNYYGYYSGIIADGLSAGKGPIYFEDNEAYSPQTIIGALDVENIASLSVFDDEYIVGMKGYTPELEVLDDKTYHTCKGSGFYTLVVCGNLGYRSQNYGTVLVWHIPIGLLGPYASRIPFQGDNIVRPEANMTDEEAASYILFSGFGLFQNDGEPAYWYAL